MFHLWNLDSLLISVDERQATKTSTANTGSAKVAVKYSADTFLVTESSVFGINSYGKIATFAKP